MSSLWSIKDSLINMGIMLEDGSVERWMKNLEGNGLDTLINILDTKPLSESLIL